MKTDKTHENHPHLSLTRTAAALSFAAVALLTTPLPLLFPSAFGIEDNNKNKNNNIPTTTAVSLTDGNNNSSATSAAANTTIAIIDNVKSMLNQSLSAYQSQNYEEAESIAEEAYLENYEFVEAPIAQHDQQLMEETEVMLREELRQMINDRVPVEQLQEHIASINANLDRAVSLLKQ
jgi:urate oxidase